MSKATFEKLSQEMHDFVKENPDLSDPQLAFLRSLAHPLAGPVVIGFVRRVATDRLPGLCKNQSDLVPSYRQLLGGE